MTRHTPGPLTFDQDGRGIYNEHGQRIANVFTVLNLPGKPEQDREIRIDEQQANGRLFSTSPDLFQFVIDYLYSEHGECAPHHETCPYCPEQLAEKARALIARVEPQETFHE